jgi:hypothetical protein
MQIIERGIEAEIYESMYDFLLFSHYSFIYTCLCACHLLRYFGPVLRV